MRNAIFFILLIITSACKVNHLVRAQPQNYTVDDSRRVVVDPELATLIGPYRQQVEEEMNEVIGELAEELTKDKPESTLGNLVADILAEEAGRLSTKSVDFAVANYGGLRVSSLPKGPVTKGAIFELLPFDNRVVILELDSAAVHTLVTHMAHDGGWPVSKGLRFHILGEKAVDIQVAGQALTNDRKYQVVLPDYLANGGSNARFLVPFPQTDTGKYMRELVIEYIQRLNRPVKVEADGRVGIMNE